MMRGAKVRPGFSPNSTYLMERLHAHKFTGGPTHSGYRPLEGKDQLQLETEDVPLLARIFGLEDRSPMPLVELHCRICGNLGDVLECDEGKHTEFYEEIADIPEDLQVIEMNEEEIQERKRRLAAGRRRP